jgi:hypothetical protein
MFFDFEKMQDLTNPHFSKSILRMRCSATLNNAASRHECLLYAAMPHE